MLVFSTRLPLKAEITHEDCMRLFTEWVKGSPHYQADGLYFDVELKRVTEVFDKELNEKKKAEEEEQMRKAFEEWVYTNVMNGTWKD